jgi:hypothetical protein
MVIMAGFVFKPEGRVEVTDAVTGQTSMVNQGWSPYIRAMLGGPKPPPWRWAGDGMIGKILHHDLERPGDDAPPEKKMYFQDLMMVRNLDRLAMVGAFIGLCILVAVGWRLRQKKEAS